MNGLSISQVALRTGFPPSTLRFYDQAGLVSPDRRPSGYRLYRNEHLDRLLFIGRAKTFGLSLDEINELLALLDENACAPVQGRLRQLIDAKIDDAQSRIAVLEQFSAELQRVRTTLDLHTPEGPCDETCGCTTDGNQPPVEVALTVKPASRDTPPIACSLPPARVRERVAEWRELVATAHDCEQISGGVRVVFDREATSVTGIARLAAAEQLCCPFLTFRLGLDSQLLTLDITGPSGAVPIIDTLAGIAQ
jgi:DNA-binding transcriptional MerR regulator